MSKKFKILFLLQSIIFANWALEKLLNALKQESIGDINNAHAVMVIMDNNCALDDLMDGTRASLKTWNRA